MADQKFTQEDINKLNSAIGPCIDDLNCAYEYSDLCKESDKTKKKLHICTTISDDGMQVDVALTNDNFFNKFLEPFISGVVIGILQAAVDSVCPHQYKFESNNGSIVIKKVG